MTEWRDTRSLVPASSREDLLEQLGESGMGERGWIRVTWDIPGENTGHIFSWEIVPSGDGGKRVSVFDAQMDTFDATEYLDRCRPDSIQWVRTDDLEPRERVLEFVEAVG